MKAALIVILTASCGLTGLYAADVRVAPACGLNSVNFEVKTRKGSGGQAQPDAGAALVYFIEDDSRLDSITKPTVRAGLDGEWAGATHGNSYFSFSVQPGEHHLCASWQSEALLLVKAGGKTAAARFQAEAGGTYYFRVKNIYRQAAHEGPFIELAPIDPDEGQLLANQYALSTFQRKN